MHTYSHFDSLSDQIVLNHGLEFHGQVLPRSLTETFAQDNFSGHD